MPPSTTRHLVATMAFGDSANAFLKISEPTFKAYAGRIGADYICINQDRYPEEPVKRYFNKNQVAGLLDQYDRILFLDVDTMVSPWCPDLFAMVPESHFGIWNERDAHSEAGFLGIYYKAQTSHHWVGEWRENYYNSGVMLFGKAHRAAFDLPETWDIIPNHFGGIGDQEWLTIRLATLQYPVYNLPAVCHWTPYNEWINPWAHIVHFWTDSFHGIMPPTEDLPSNGQRLYLMNRLRKQWEDQAAGRPPDVLSILEEILANSPEPQIGTQASRLKDSNHPAVLPPCPDFPTARWQTVIGKIILQKKTWQSQTEKQEKSRRKVELTARHAAKSPQPPDSASLWNQWKFARNIETAPPCILAGPFRGMRFIRQSHGSSLECKWLGTYEMEIHDWIEKIAANPTTHLINVGAGEGYYAVGLARRMTKTRFTVFEANPPALKTIRRLARLNRVERRIIIRGACTQGSLQKVLQPHPGAWLIVDCEGVEMVLLNPEAVPALLKTRILLEFHELRDGSTTAGIIRSRFQQTHDIVEILPADRSWADLPRSVRWQHLMSDRRPWLERMDEARERKTGWLVLRPKK